MTNHLYAYDFIVDGIAYNKLTDNTCEVAKYRKVDSEYGSMYTGNFVIPSTVTSGTITYTVTAIGEEAFYESEITTVRIPETVTIISNEAFENCEKLSEITIGKNVTQVGDVERGIGGVFHRCFSLEHSMAVMKFCLLQLALCRQTHQMRKKD